MVTIFTNENCMPCNMTKKFFKENSIPFLERSITDEKNLEDAKATGFTQMPIVVLTEKNYVSSGFVPAKFKELMA